ncbi:BrnT family toxin [Phenylobacterium sp.]|uniref:BrnT family toxin n=1 Tax=Phenylobacterium sp. TaxID=1871053 RepID=UPI003918F623
MSEQETSYFEWDEGKAELNLRKHGISFDDAAYALLGLALTQESSGYEETRFTSICIAEGRLIVVVWTPRDGAIRIISARAARTNERKQYDQAIGRSASARHIGLAKGRPTIG